VFFIDDHVYFAASSPRMLMELRDTCSLTDAMGLVPAAAAATTVDAVCVCSELLGSVFLMLLSPSARLYVRPLIGPFVEGHPRCSVYFVRYV